MKQILICSVCKSVSHDPIGSRFVAYLVDRRGDFTNFSLPCKCVVYLILID